MEYKIIKRFWAKVYKTESCWFWCGGKTSIGYGAFTYEGKTEGAHRISMTLAGYDIEGRDVLHSCDKRNCVNPAHLFLGDDKANYEDARSKGRHAHGENHGSAKLNWEKVAMIRVRLNYGESLPVLSKEFGVSVNTIFKIDKNKIWKVEQ